MNPEDNKKSAEETKKLIDNCLQTPIDELTKHEDWGTINFEGAKPDLIQFFKILTQYKVLPIEDLLAETISQINQKITDVHTQIERIKGFKIEQNDASGVRDAITVEIKREIDAFFKVAAPWMPYLAFQRGDIDKNIQQFTGAVEEGKKIVAGAKEYVETRKGEIDKIVLATKEAAATTGVAHFTAQFKEESELMATRAKWWLGWTIALVVLTVTAAGIFYYLSADVALQGYQLTQLIITKVVILLILFSATVWTGRIYKALKHQESVNKHRANSLKTFQAFVQATNDELTRDAVLIEATRAIFGITNSGYLESQQEDHTPSTQIIEMIKGAGKQ